MSNQRTARDLRLALLDSWSNYHRAIVVGSSSMERAALSGLVKNGMELYRADFGAGIQQRQDVYLKREPERIN